MIVLRRGDGMDIPFMRSMLAYAYNFHTNNFDVDVPVGRYVDGWGRPGDTAVVAEDAASRPIGAAWYRLFDPALPGYGFLDASIPELTIGVLGEHRGRGIGRALLNALLANARAAGFPALSLSVERTNPAAALYERVGFRKVGESGGSWTMRVDVSQT